MCRDGNGKLLERLLWVPEQQQPLELDTVEDVEAALEQCVVADNDSDERPAVVYYPVPDTSWLSCRRLGARNVTAAATTTEVARSSILGLLEDTDCAANDVVRVTLWKKTTTSVNTNGNDGAAGEGHTH